jgi:hypothetical protein
MGWISKIGSRGKTQNSNFSDGLRCLIWAFFGKIGENVILM